MQPIKKRYLKYFNAYTVKLNLWVLVLGYQSAKKIVELHDVTLTL